MRNRRGWPVRVMVGLVGVGLLVAAPGPVPAIGAPAGISPAAGATVSAVAGFEYTIVDLGTLGGDSSHPWGVNDQGQVAGVADTASGERHAFLWDPVTGMRDLGTLGGTWSEAKAVNDRGQVVGSSQVDRRHDHAFLWDPVTGMRDLGTLGGHDSDAFDLNDQGQVVGWAYTAEWDHHPFLWDPAAGMTDLDAFGSDWSEALAVNERGQVMGTHDAGGFLWDPVAGMTDLGRAGIHAESLNEKGQVAGGPPAFLWDPMSGLTQLGGLPGHGESWAVDVNDEGLVAGWSGTWDDWDDDLIEQRAWLWDQGTGMADLGTLGGKTSWAGTLNERGQVAGSADTASGEHHAFLWDPEFGMTDLGALGGNFSRAVAMNDRGQVVGWSTDEGVSEAVLFTPSSLAPQVRVRVAKSRYGNKLRVNVNPNRIGDAWKFRVQKRTAGVWTTLPTVYWTWGTAETRKLTMGPGRFRVKVANRYGYTGTTSPPVRLTRKTARVHLGTDPARTRLRVNVDPNKGAGYWTFRVQRQRADSTWRTLRPTYTTFGNRETRTLNLNKGTYRVKVQAKYGYRGTTSTAVQLRS